MDTKELLTQQNFQYNKQFGQNFIYDTNLLSAIVRDSGLTSQDYCLEIGAGAGTLTREIAKVANKVLSYEIDKKLKEFLSTNVALSNVEFVFEDFLKGNIQEVESKIGCNYKVVANLPYYITTPLLMTFVEQAKNCTSLTVMVQKEVADRLCSKPDTKQYGAVTVAVQAVADVSIARKVPASAFVPRPDVDSAVVNVVFNYGKYSIPNREIFRKTVKAAFAMRRKTLENNLLNSFSLSREQIRDILTQAGIPVSARGETLSVQKFVTLSSLLEKTT